MKTLYVLRHGKSDWSAEYSDDFDRPLAPRGVKAAGHVGRFLSAIGEMPEHVITSSAVRAAETTGIAAEEGGWDTEIVAEAALYGASSGRMLKVVQRASKSAKSVMLVTHEPGISEFVGRTIGGAQLRFPTAALACIDWDRESWSNVEFGEGVLRWFVLPRMLEDYVRNLDS